MHRPGLQTLFKTRQNALSLSTVQPSFKYCSQHCWKNETAFLGFLLNLTEYVKISGQEICIFFSIIWWINKDDDYSRCRPSYQNGPSTMHHKHVQARRHPWIRHGLLRCILSPESASGWRVDHNSVNAVEHAQKRCDTYRFIDMLCSKCRDYDCRDVDSAHWAECRRLTPCRPTSVSQSIADHDWSRTGSLLPSSADSLRLMKACVKAHCTSSLESTLTVDFDCANALCSRRLLPAGHLAEISTDTAEQAVGERTSPQSIMDLAKRAGFTDTAGTCMAFHCAGKSPGTLEFLLCASRNRCAG